MDKIWDYPLILIIQAKPILSTVVEKIKDCPVVPKQQLETCF